MSKRVSLILKDVDEEIIAPYLNAATAEHEALRLWADERGVPVVSEASALRVLLQAGAAALREEIMARCYEDLAGEFNSPVCADERRAARGRYANRTDPGL